MDLQAIIFDVDGTLADAEEIHRAAFNRAFRDADLSWHWDRRLYGELLRVAGGKERLRHFVQSQGMEADIAAFPTLIASLHERNNACYAELVRTGAAPLRRGFEALIRQAVIADMGLAFLSPYTLGLELQFGLLRTLAVEGQPFMRRWFVVHPQSRTLSPAAESFRYFILEHGERFLATQFGSMPRGAPPEM